MLKYKYLLYLSMAILAVQTGFCQTFKAGDKAEALINNVWKEGKVLKTVPGKPNVYEIEIAGIRQGIAKSVVQVNKTNLRTVKTNTVTVATTAATTEAPKTVDPHLGKYDLYSGIPSMYIGHLVLLTGGKYKVALSTDEDNYELGSYTFDAATNTIEWQSGLFKNNSWKGKLLNPSGNNFKIEFNKVTFAESN